MDFMAQLTSIRVKHGETEGFKDGRGWLYKVSSRMEEMGCVLLSQTERQRLVEDVYRLVEFYPVSGFAKTFWGDACPQLCMKESAVHLYVPDPMDPHTF